MKTIVISKSYEAALGIGRSLKIAGYDVDLFYIGVSNKDIVFASNAFTSKASFDNRDDECIVNKLIEIYRNTSENRIVLFPGDDYATSLVDRYRNRLEAFFIYTYSDCNQNGAITRLMDKKYQVDLSKRFGLQTAKSWVSDYSNGHFVIPEGIVLPCFVKPLISAVGAAKANMKKCNDLTELRNHLDHLVEIKQYGSVIIQEFINIEEEYNIHGICDGNRIFLPIIHRKMETARFNKGVTILGKNMNPQHLEPYISRLKDMLLSMGYHGIFNVEMFKSNGTTYLNEINVRIAGTCWGATGAGANIPDLWVRCLLGEIEQWPQLNIKYNTLFINDKTAYEDLVHGFRKSSELKKWNSASDFHLLMSSDDPQPWKVFYKRMRKILFKQKIKHILHM